MATAGPSPTSAARRRATSLPAVLVLAGAFLGCSGKTCTEMATADRLTIEAAAPIDRICLDGECVVPLASNRVGPRTVLSWASGTIDDGLILVEVVVGSRQWVIDVEFVEEEPNGKGCGVSRTLSLVLDEATGLRVG